MGETYIESRYIQKAYQLISGREDIRPYYIEMTRKGAERGFFTDKAIMVCAELLQELDEEID